MKKTLSSLLVIIMFVSLCITIMSCKKADSNETNYITCSSCGQENLSNVKYCSNCGEQIKDKAQDKDPDSNIVEEPKKTAKQKLCDYIKENGANYQGTYKIIELLEDGSFTMSCTPQDELIFVWNYEYNNQITYVKMDFYEGSVTQTVTYQYELSGYTCIATGTIYTSIISLDNCKVYGVSYKDNFPSSVSSQLDNLVNSTFPTSVKAMLAEMNVVLLKYTDVKMSDLGFTNLKTDN